MWCTRAWWIMHSLGVDCAILNGGFERWRSEGRAVSCETTTYPPARFVPGASTPRAVATKADVLEALADPRACVVDALPAASYAGNGTAYGGRKGHITGAVNVPMDTLLDAEGRFFDASAMRARLQAVGVLEGERVITYCGAGIAASVDAFALALLGHRAVSVYDASLSEWGADPDLPMSDAPTTSARPA